MLLLFQNLSWSNNKMTPCIQIKSDNKHYEWSFHNSNNRVWFNNLDAGSNALWHDFLNDWLILCFWIAICIQTLDNANFVAATGLLILLIAVLQFTILQVTCRGWNAGVRTQRIQLQTTPQQQQQIPTS